MHRKVLALLILLMYLAANECGLPPTLRSPEQKDVALTDEKNSQVREKQASGNISSSEAPDISNHTTDVQNKASDDQHKHKAPNIDGTQQENCTKSGTDVIKEDNPQSSSVEPSGEESNTKQQVIIRKRAPDEVHKQVKHQNTSGQLLEDGSPHQQEYPNKTNEKQTSESDTKDRTEQQNKIRLSLGGSNNEDKEVHPILVTGQSKENKSSTVKKYLPKTSEPQKYQAISLKDFHEDSPGDINLQKQKGMQVLKVVVNTGQKVAESSNNLQVLESARSNEQKEQSSSVVLSVPIDSLISSTENPGEAGLLDIGPQHPAQISSPEHFLSSSNIQQETNTQEYFDPDLYVRPQLAEDLVTTNNALDPKPPVTTYSGFKPSFPVRTAIPQYAVKEDHPDDLAPHHFGHLPYALDRAKFIQYQQTASRYPYYVRGVPLQRNFNVPYPVLVERKAQSFSLPLKVLVHQPVVVQAEDKVLYPATKPFSFTVHHGTPIGSEDVHDDVGQGRDHS